MGRNCFEGYLTEECGSCQFWLDGSNGRIGCDYPGPIDNCSAFKKMFEEDAKKEQGGETNGNS